MRRPAVLAVVALLALPAAAAAKGDGAVALVAGPGGLYAALPRGAVVRIDPAADRIAARGRVAGFPRALAVSGGDAWVAATPGDAPSSVVHLDSRALARRPGDPPGGGDLVAAGDGTVWTATSSGRRLTGVDAATGRVVRRAWLPRGIAAIAVGGDRLWVALYGRRVALLRLDAATGRRAAPPVSLRGRPWDLVADRRGAWIRTGYRILVGIDRGGPARRVRFDADIASPTLAPSAAWVQTQSGLARVDRRDGRVRIVAASTMFPSRLAAGWGSVWVADLLAPRISRIDPRTGAVTARIALPR